MTDRIFLYTTYITSHPWANLVLEYGRYTDELFQIAYCFFT